MAGDPETAGFGVTQHARPSHGFETGKEVLAVTGVPVIPVPFQLNEPMLPFQLVGSGLVVPGPTYW